MANRSSSPRKAESAPGLSARLLSHAALKKVMTEKKSGDDCLPQINGWSALSQEDRGLSHALLMGVLRHLGQIDAWLDLLMERPLPSTAGHVKDIARMGLFQLGWMGTPAHAAVDTSVNMARSLRLDGFAGLLNAVLRRAAREGVPPVIAEGHTLNLPGWLRDNWNAAYGEEQVKAICRAQADIPPLDIQVKSDAEGWAEKLSGKLLPGGTIRLAVRSVTDLPGYTEGEWWVQDVAASLPVRLLGEVRGKTIVDLCAAPGGKTLQLAAAGANVIAVDRSEPRLERLRENLARMRLKAEIICADAKDWIPPGPVDGVLIDAPCSATGTLRRHPEIAFTRTPKDVERLAALQTALLDKVLSWLPGGVPLIYATCSLQPEEGERQIERLLREYQDISIQPPALGELPLPEAVSRQGYARTLPSFHATEGGMDGFFMARLIKN